MPVEPTYLVLGCKPWNRCVFEETIRHLPGAWSFCADHHDLTAERVDAIAPRYVFVLHWSWRISASIVEPYECVGFHMTDLPYGRGGTPLQNLIARGHRETRLTAFRMIDELDAGPVYLKEKLSLEGSAEDILIRATRLSARLIERMIAEAPTPVPQRGEPVIFTRRTPEQSRMPSGVSLEALYDFVRMLDAETYPRAFLEHDGFRYEFGAADLHDGRIEARVTISPVGETSS